MYYPDNSVVIATDFDEMYREIFLQNFKSESSEAAFMSHLTLDRFIQTFPEELLSIPDNSVSIVICIHMLCQSRDLFRALAEIKRVLLPKGRFYFIEHVQEFEKFSWKWFMQLKFLPAFAHVSCHVGRPSQNVIKRCGFLEVNIKEFRADLTNVGPRPIRALMPHIYGYAVN